MASKRRRTGPASIAPAAAGPHKSHTTLVLLLVILVVAALTRIIALPYAPPGLNQDEAVNAWNAWCLIKTGHDQDGAAWPIYYYRALGGNSTTLFLWWTIPFEFLGGMNFWTARLPSAIAGVLTILLTYWVITRLFDRSTGLLAAALLTLSPWHIQLSRWGHEAILGPLTAFGSLALLLWAGFPLRDAPSRPSAWRALIAGIVIGISCYGYGSIRLFLPVFLTGCVLLNARAWWQSARTRSGFLALAAVLIGVGITFGPLAYQHVAHPEGVSKHAKQPGFAVWEDTDSSAVRAAKVINRYFGHFGPDFLFINGDRIEIQAAPGFGMLSWYMAPLIAIGLLVMLLRLTRSRAARIMLCWLLIYPIGDILYRGARYPAADGTMLMSMHALRSAPGLPVLVVLGALGAAAAGRALAKRSRPALLAGAGALAVVAVVLTTQFLLFFYGPYVRRPAVQRGFHVDLMNALAWLKPRLGSADAVFITKTGLNTPYIVALVALNYDPEQWFRDEKTMTALGEWEHFTQVGKFYYMYGPSANPAVETLYENGRPDHVFFIVRPGELKLTDPVYTVHSPAGQPTLLVYETEF